MGVRIYIPCVSGKLYAWKFNSFILPASSTPGSSIPSFCLQQRVQHQATITTSPATPSPRELQSGLNFSEKMDDSRSIRRLDDVSSSHFLRNRDSFFSNFFDKDPFDDPFFNRPFGSMFPPANDFLEPFHQRHSARLFDGRRQQQEGSRGVVIEELSDNQEDAVGARSQTHSEPIVEHPDDNALSHSDRDRSKGFSQSFSFSSVMYGGPQGSYYKSSTIRRAGGDGLYEEVHEENDSINDRQTNQIIHGLGNKGHAVTRKKSASGAEDYEEILHNLTEEEKTDFDSTWRKQAKKYLPGHGKSNAPWWKFDYTDHEHEGERDGNLSSTKSTKQLTWRWPWAKKA